jgi:hypothetical protein
MEAKELMIGNYVLQDNEFIKGITSNSIHKFDLGFIKLEPILITEEWLFKFGFKDRSGTLKNKMSYGIEIGKMEIAWYRQDNKTRFQTIENGFILKYVNYVHELQNLYFSLTGEELIIK